jgi:peroxiredoxin
MTKRIFIIFIAICSILFDLYAQQNTNNPLQGLKIAGPGDIEPGTPLMLDPNVTPIFYENFSPVKGNDFMNIMMSGDYVPEPYIDSNKVVKAFVMRKATDEEKKGMLQMQKNMEGNNLMGKKAFPFTVKDINGKKYSLEKLKGKVVVLNFWFVECKPCVMEIPELNNLVDKYKDKDVVFIGFSTNDKAKIKSFTKKATFKYNLVADSKEIADFFEVFAFPTHFVIDKNSVISFYAPGLGPTTMSDLDKMIESLLK